MFSSGITGISAFLFLGVHIQSTVQHVLLRFTIVLGILVVLSFITTRIMKHILR